MGKPLFKYAVLFIVVVVAVVFSRLLGPRLFFNALVKKDYVEREGYSETISYSFKENGCYSIGLVSRTKKMSWYVTEGKYRIEFLDSNGELIDVVDITKNRAATVNRSFRILDMYIFDIPFKGKYRDLKIRYSVIKPDPVLQKVEESIILYLQLPTIGLYKCGKEFENEINKKTYGIKTYKETEPQFVPLFSAIKNHDFKAVKSIFSRKKMSLDVKMSGNREPIHYAAYYNDTKTLRYLIDHKVDLNPTDITGYTPIQYAIANNGPEAVSLLLNNGIDIKLIDSVPNILSGYKDDYRPYNPLYYAVNICSGELLKIMIEKGIDIEQYDQFELIEKNKILDYLVLKKCRESPDAENIDASQMKYKDIEKLLISYGAKRSPVRLRPVYIGRKEK